MASHAALSTKPPDQTLVELSDLAITSRGLSVTDLSSAETINDDSKHPPQQSNVGSSKVLVTWDGSSDPHNPANWPASKKMVNVAIVSCLGFLTPFSSTAPSPGMSKTMIEFQVNSDVLAGFATSIYVLGNAVGPILVAPASEIYGRLALYHTSNVCFTAFTIGCALSTSLPMLMVFRFLAGCAGAAPVVIGGGTIGDMIPVQERGKYTAIFAAGSLIGPIVGPIAGGYLTLAVSWRWGFWLVAIAGGAATILSFLVLRETHAATVLKHQARALRKKYPSTEFEVQGAVTEPTIVIFERAFTRPMKMLFTSPVVFSLALFQALCFGYMYLLFTTFPTTFSDQYHFNAGESGLAFLGFGLGAIIGLAAILFYSDRTIVARARKAADGQARPESRLLFMIYGVSFLPVGLFWYGWSAEAKTHWIVPILGTFVLALGIMAVSLPSNLYMIDYFTIYAASALAAVTFLRSILGGLLPLAGGPMYSRLSLGWGSSVLGFIALAFCIVPVGLVAFGEQMRKRFPVNL